MPSKEKRTEQRRHSVLLLLTAVASPLIAGASLWLTVQSSEQQWKDDMENRVLSLERENAELRVKVVENRSKLDARQNDFMPCVIRNMDKVMDKLNIAPACPLKISP